MFKRPTSSWLLFVLTLLFIPTALENLAARPHPPGVIYVLAPFAGLAALGLLVRFRAADVREVSFRIPEWLRAKLSLSQRRIIMLVASVPLWISLLSLMTGKTWFGEHEKQFRAIAGLGAGGAYWLFGPTAEEIRRQYWKKAREYLRWRHDQERDRN